MQRELPASILLAPKKEPTVQKIFDQMNLPILLREDFLFLLHSRSRKEFFDTLVTLARLSKSELALITRAYDVAEREFRDIFRESGERYFEHLRRCVLILILYVGILDANMIAAMLLHDLLEMKRRSWSYERLAKVFNEEVAMLVWWLTKLPRNKTTPTRALVNAEYFLRLSRAPLDAIILKAVDRLDNLLTLWPKSLRKVRRILRDTETYVLPLLRTHDVLDDEVQVVVTFIKEALGYA